MRKITSRIASPLAAQSCLATALAFGFAVAAGEKPQAPPQLEFAHAPSRAATEVDFRWAPPEWQTAICLPDDPHKSLVDKSGELLDHYGRGNQGGKAEFGSRIAVVVDPQAVWRKQELLSPKVPVVRTFRAAPDLEILEEAFALTDPVPNVPVRRTDGNGEARNWAAPPPGVDPSLKDIAVHNDGPLRFEVAAASGTLALALCEGWWAETGKRVQILRVEGAQPQQVDTVADIGKNKAAAFWFDAKDTDGDGKVAVTVEAAPQAADKNTILNGLWVFPSNMKKDTDALLAGRLDGESLGGLRGPPARPNLILIHVTNTGKEDRIFHPKLVIDNRVAAAPVTYLRGEDDTPLETLAVPAGKSASFLFQHGGKPLTLAQARQARENSIRFWENHPALPFGSVAVPDPGIQALVDSSIRNIWQAREIKNGMNAFQVGPTCYRGLWIVDGAFILEAATMLGAGAQARDGVAYELSHQKPDGRFEILGDFHKENGIVLWTCWRHARLTRDKAWLESVWPQLERTAAYIAALRKRSLTDDSPLNDGLMPKGNPDGGQGGVLHEYSNTCWNLVGLDAFVKAARWLGKDRQADQWQRESDDFMNAFRRAAQRDSKTDPNGNRYLPNRMDGHDLPQRAQWAFCHAVYPGQLFAKDDPLAMGNLAMLQATEREGMVYGTGWDATGIWNYFASFHAHAWLQQGNGRKAAQQLYAFANHAAPVLLWREEQSLQGEPYKKVGDMPHNWASAEFIRLVIHLLAFDRGSELHLLQGLPEAWIKPGMLTRLNRVATPFGPFTMELNVNDTGTKAKLSTMSLNHECTAIIVHQPDGTTRHLKPDQGNEIEIPLP